MIEKRVFKWRINGRGKTTLADIPCGEFVAEAELSPRFFKVEVQPNDGLVVFGEVAGKDKMTIELMTIETGQAIPQAAMHIDSVQLMTMAEDGPRPVVYHVFQLTHPTLVLN